MPVINFFLCFEYERNTSCFKGPIRKKALFPEASSSQGICPSLTTKTAIQPHQTITPNNEGATLPIMILRRSGVINFGDRFVIFMSFISSSFCFFAKRELFTRFSPAVKDLFLSSVFPFFSSTNPLIWQHLCLVKP